MRAASAASAEFGRRTTIALALPARTRPLWRLMASYHCGAWSEEATSAAHVRSPRPLTKLREHPIGGRLSRPLSSRAPREPATNDGLFSSEYARLSEYGAHSSLGRTCRVPKRAALASRAHEGARKLAAAVRGQHSRGEIRRLALQPRTGGPAGPTAPNKSTNLGAR